MNATRAAHPHQPHPSRSSILDWSFALALLIFGLGGLSEHERFLTALKTLAPFAIFYLLALLAAVLTILRLIASTFIARDRPRHPGEVMAGRPGKESIMDHAPATSTQTAHGASYFHRFLLSSIVSSSVALFSLAMAVTDGLTNCQVTHPLLWLPIFTSSVGVAGASYLRLRKYLNH